MDTIGVAAIDSHPVVLEGVAAVLARNAPDIELLGIARSCAEHLSGPGADADVVLLELGLSRRPRVEVTVARLVAHGQAVIVLTGEERPMPLLRAVEAGAAGLILKADPVEAIPAVIRDVHHGRPASSGPLAESLLAEARLGARLSVRQVEILEAVSSGLPYRLVAKELGIAEVTVREHLSRAAQAYRMGGVDIGNVHGLISRARADGHLSE